jgi:glycogen debranching enzyme
MNLCRSTVFVNSSVLLLAFTVSYLPNMLSAKSISPVLEFPQTGMDDPIAYKDYKTRFFQDTASNCVQIYLREDSGRVVHLEADSLNESIGFSMRQISGEPVPIEWGSEEADISVSGNRRSLQYSLVVSSAAVRIGHLILGSMRKERDFQYDQKHLLPLNSPAFDEPELLTLIENLTKLSELDQQNQLTLLQATSVEELRRRMAPKIVLKESGSGSIVEIEQTSFDAKNHLWMQILIQNNQEAKHEENTVIVRSKDNNSPLKLVIEIATDGPALTPLNRSQIFNQAFLQYYESEKSSAMKNPSSSAFKWLDREVRGMELVSYEEKLMAGLPNFATYFGRDTMMSAFMLEPIWNASMLEHAISSVLRKLAPSGEVSHEEALGGQAIRENAGEYNRIMELYWKETDKSKGQKILDEARVLLQDLQATRENYRMVDDDFQLAVLVSRYLNHQGLSSERKKEFLLDPISSSRREATRLSLIMRNLDYIATVTDPFATKPEVLNLVSFFKSDKGTWISGSWRDSEVGYAGGRFAMDVNVIWVPNALKSLLSILDSLRAVGFVDSDLQRMASDLPGARFKEYIRNNEELQKAAETWDTSIQHFKISLTQTEVESRIHAKLNSLSAEERQYWNAILVKTRIPAMDFQFLALSLDDQGKAIPVMNTDPATLLYIAGNLPDPFRDSLLLPYPVGLFVENLGLLVANDAYASPAIWNKFEKDRYHAPTVVWGREVNLFILGLIRNILDSSKSRESLETFQLDLNKIATAVDKSGLKHSELWSYRIENGKLIPSRYGTSSDIQLWNLTDLSVQFLMHGISQRKIEIHESR